MVLVTVIHQVSDVNSDSSDAREGKIWMSETSLRKRHDSQADFAAKINEHMTLKVGKPKFKDLNLHLNLRIVLRIQYSILRSVLSRSFPTWSNTTTLLLATMKRLWSSVLGLTFCWHTNRSTRLYQHRHRRLRPWQPWTVYGSSLIKDKAGYLNDAAATKIYNSPRRVQNTTAPLFCPWRTMGSPQI